MCILTHLTLNVNHYIDTETTGTNPDQYAIIELGMVLFEFGPKTGLAYNVLVSFDELEYPGFPIPLDSTVTC